MGRNTEVALFYGFRIPLNLAFESKLLKSDIVDSYDYQLISWNEKRDEVITKYVISPILKNILKDKQWNLYILTSSQDDCDPNTSYLFLYNKRQELTSESPDYETGIIDATLNNGNDIVDRLTKIPLQQLQMPFSWDYHGHWVVETSW